MKHYKIRSLNIPRYKDLVYCCVTYHSTIENRNNLKTTSKTYKRTMDKYKTKYTTKLARKLSELRSTNSKEYWKILNSTNKNKKCTVDIDEML